MASSVKLNQRELIAEAFKFMLHVQPQEQKGAKS